AWYSSGLDALGRFLEIERSLQMQGSWRSGRKLWMKYGHIQAAKDGAEAWKALADIYEKDSQATRISLKRQIYGYKHVATTPIQDYISGITGLAARLKSI